MKRNTRQLCLMILVFGIIAVAYACRFLAMYDIVGSNPSYVRAALYLLLFVLWGYSLDQRIIQKPVLHCLRLMAALILIWMIFRTFKYEIVTNLTVARYLVVSVLPSHAVYSAPWGVCCYVYGEA